MTNNSTTKTNTKTNTKANTKANTKTNTMANTKTNTAAKTTAAKATAAKATAAKATAAKATAAPLYTFAADSVTINGRVSGAMYSVALGGDLYVFTGIDAGVGRIPVRMHITQEMPQYADAMAAAKLAAAAEAAKSAKAAEPAKPAPVQDAPKAAKSAKAAKVAKPAPVQPAAEPAPVQDAPKAAKPAKAQNAAPADCKTWIGSTITGKGWRIVFDGDAQRTRVIFDAKPTAAQAAAVDAARFFWSPAMGSYNKHLTCKAHRAALDLAQTLRGLAA